MLEMDPWTMVTLKLGRDFVCGRCMKQADRFMNSMAELNKEVETVWGSCDSKSNNWLGEVQGMQGVAELKKVLAEAERNGLSEVCKIGNVIWEWDMVFEAKWDENFKKDRESNASCKKLMEKKRTVDMMDMLGFRWQRRIEWDGTGMCWGGVMGTLEFEVRGKRKPRRPEKTWKTQVEKKSKSVDWRARALISQWKTI